MARRQIAGRRVGDLESEVLELLWLAADWLSGREVRDRARCRLACVHHGDDNPVSSGGQRTGGERGAGPWACVPGGRRS